MSNFPHIPVDDLINFFKLMHYFYTTFNSRNSSDTTRDNYQKKFQKMVTYTMKTFQPTLYFICTGPSQSNVVTSFIDATVKKNGFKETTKYCTVPKWLRVYLYTSKHLSLERRVVSSLLYKNFPANQIDEMK